MLLDGMHLAVVCAAHAACSHSHSVFDETCVLYQLCRGTYDSRQEVPVQHPGPRKELPPWVYTTPEEAARVYDEAHISLVRQQSPQQTVHGVL